MAAVTGTLTHKHGDAEYRMALTMLGLADLQDRFGMDIGGILSDTPPALPPFRVIVEIVAAGLMRGEGMDRDEALPLADEMTTADKLLWQRVWNTSFPPPAEPGNAPAPTKAKPKR